MPFSGVLNSRVHVYWNGRTFGKICQKKIVEHLFYTVSIAMNKRTRGLFSNSMNSQMCLIIRDTIAVQQRMHNDKLS